MQESHRAEIQLSIFILLEECSLLEGGSLKLWKGNNSQYQEVPKIYRIYNSYS